MLTVRPDSMSIEQHKKAEEQGWAIFIVDGKYQVQAIDELNMIDDQEAIRLAREMGINCDVTGFLFKEPID